MNILVTGAKGFIGRNLVSQLHNIQSGKARNYPVSGTELKVFEYDTDSDPAVPFFSATILTRRKSQTRMPILSLTWLG